MCLPVAIGNGISKLLSGVVRKIPVTRKQPRASIRDAAHQGLMRLARSHRVDLASKDSQEFASVVAPHPEAPRPPGPIPITREQPPLDPSTDRRNTD